MDIINALLAADVDVNAQLSIIAPAAGEIADGSLIRSWVPDARLCCATRTPHPSAHSRGGDAEVVRVLLAKGANPNINDMGVTPFLVAAGVGAGHIGGTGLAAQYSFGGPVNMELMELLLQHGADVNAQVTGTRTYSASPARRPRMKAERLFTSRRRKGKWIWCATFFRKAPTPRSLMPAGLSQSTWWAKARPRALPWRRCTCCSIVNPATLAEIRTLLENAASRK